MSAGLIGFWTAATIFVAVATYVCDLFVQKQIARESKDDVIIATNPKQMPIAMIVVALALAIILPLIIVGCDPYLWVVSAIDK